MNANEIVASGVSATPNDLRSRSAPGRSNRRRRRIAAGRALALLTGAGMALVATPTIAVAQVAPPQTGAEWVRPAGTLQGTRFSGLEQINTTNVGRLKEEFDFDTDVVAGHEGAPLVVNNTMYVVSPFPNFLFALDLKDKGKLKWKFNPRADPFAEGKACCDIVNRGAVFATHPSRPNGLIIYNVLDTTVVAVDAKTGKEVWRNKLGNVRIGETMTMAPLVIGDRVFVGNSGGEMGVRGFIASLRVSDGQDVRKAFSTGPDADVRIGPDFRAFYPKDQGENLGVRTWPGDLWQLGGSTVWAWLTYDPDLNLLFHGTANPGVWNHEVRPGDNKWSATVFARRPDTLDAVWAYQITPHDAHDYDGVNENIVVDLPVNGVMRKLIVRFDRNGFAYTQDRTTGEVLLAPKFNADVNWASAIDLTTGAPVVNEAKTPKTGVVVPDICPAAAGGKDQQPAAFSPKTGLFYVPANNMCMDFEALHVNYIEGTPFIGASPTFKAGTNGQRGEFFAWNAATGQKAWSNFERFPVWSGVLATAGDVVFYGTFDRFFRAVDARNGYLLFEKEMPSGVIGHPMTFLGPDGKQRVAVYSGAGGWAGAIVPHEFAPDDPFAAAGFVGAMFDLPQFTPPGGTLHVFKIDGSSGSGSSGQPRK